MSASAEDALRRQQQWRALNRCEAQIGGESHHGLLGTMRYDSQGRDFGRAPSPLVRNDLGARVTRVQAALDEAPRMAFRELAQRFEQLDLSMIVPLLGRMVHDIALFVGTGAVVGGGLGFVFGGGVGAVPGAALGAEAGTLALNLIGMASLLGELGKVIPDALRHYVQGFRQAWGAMPEPGQRTLSGSSAGFTANAFFGAHEIAQGHVLMLSALLMGVMLWVSKGGVSRSRLLSEIRDNPRLGATMANWVEANEGRFQTQLQNISKREVAAGSQGALPKATPVQSSRPATPPKPVGSKAPVSSASPPQAAPAPVSSKPEWLKRLDAGNDFNRAQAPKYPYNEVYIDKPSGDGYFRLDSYNPESGEIVSRKFTQLSEVQQSTATGYLAEIEQKYPVDATVAKVPSSGSLAGTKLQGQYILEVPVQTNPVPQAVLDAANNAGILIRDVTGHVY